MQAKTLILMASAAALVPTAVVVGPLLAERAPSAITIDYPSEGSIFPPDFAPPTFIWRDAAGDSDRWQIEVAFSDGSKPLRVKTPGEPMRIGEIDPRCIGPTNELPKLTPEQAHSRTWVPDAEVWAAIKRHSVERPATVTITGFGKDKAVSSGRVTILTSKDPVGAPIFYRDVPLMPSETERGVIKPLAANALPLIAWRLRNVSDTKSRLLLTDMHSCANCHSVSLDGTTFGMDVDGPASNKGMFALTAIKPQMTIRNENIITWATTKEMQASRDRVGFMSQISPNGRYVVTRLSGPVGTIRNSVYTTNFTDYHFLQVFYPTRGILAFYDRATRHTQSLPGADDTAYVQTDGVWTPDGKYIVFARTEAKDPNPLGGKMALYANDPNEVQIQYDLYRIPFNGGKGGRAERIVGASRNGMSNNFPKVSPDGRWIVFVQCRNGQLMRPDSQLYIVPFEGGQARRLRCNMLPMNSWHSFSPNGRWLVFSSKRLSPYTHMFLTHLDENGNDSPAILIENATAANRAVNIPEFMNIPPDGLEKIDVPAADFFRQFDLASDLLKKGDYAAAVPEWKKAVALNPEYARAEISLGVALAKTGKTEEAMAAYRKAAEIDPDYPDSYAMLGFALASQGKLEEAIPELVKALQLDPADEASQRAFCAALSQSASRTKQAIEFCQLVLTGLPNDPAVHVNLAVALFRSGNVNEAISHLEKAAELSPGDATIQSNLGAALAQRGRFAEAVPHFEKALAIDPQSAEAHYNLGTLYYLQQRVPDALAQWRQVVLLDPNHVLALNRLALVLAASPDASLRNGSEAVALAERAVRLSGGREPAFLDTLAAAYAEAGRYPEATQTARRALDLAKEQSNADLAQALSGRIALYEARTPFRQNP